ncbi:MAG: LysE family translocator [Actinomycetota bacterium]
MPAIEAIITFAIASLALLLIPGPAVIYILNRSVSDGREAGLAAVAGLEIGNFVHVIAASAGLSAVLATSAAAFNVVKWLGAGYLVFVGVRTLLAKPSALDSDSSVVSRRRSFVQGIVVNILNPKVALFFLSYLPQFIDPDNGAAWTQALVLGSIFVLIGCLTDGTYALTASALRSVLLSGRTLPFVQRYVAGTVFIALGLMASTSSRATSK